MKNKIYYWFSDTTFEFRPSEGNDVETCDINSIIFESANEMLSKFLSRENIKTIKDLKDYLANYENRILLEDWI
mgnify:CR=1 FL=1